MQTVRRQLDRLFAVHMVIAVVTGALCFLTPHSLMAPMLGDASNTHLAHEFVRLYGTSNDPALATAAVRADAGAGLDGVAHAARERRAHPPDVLPGLLHLLPPASGGTAPCAMASPESHSMLHWINILLLSGLGCAYGYFLVFKTIKAFELPGMEKGLL
ncbi:hypothetical protein GQ600_9991 [Phytophthora cactorum]|nr:hypothetical protein GQ600_9991 [Phytophthora cactorum]